MPLYLVDKKAIVKEVTGIADQAMSLVVADYCGLRVGDLTRLRVKARESGVYLRVVRNTLASRALQNTPFDCLKDALVGPLILAFSMEHPGAAARIFKDFAKEHEKFQIKCLAVQGKMLNVSDLDKLANIPTFEGSISMLMAALQAPISKLLAVLNAPQTKLVRTFVALRDSKSS